jgi:O-antigen ligase
MSIEKIKLAYLWSIKSLLFVIPFLSLLITQSMFFPFITGRNFAFRILIEVALILWIGLMTISKEYRPRLSFLSGALLVFLAILGLADSFGIFPHKAFWSNYERMEGFITFLHLGVYFFILSSVMKSKKEWLKFLNVFVLAGALVAFYGLFQKFGWVEVLQPGFKVRPVSTIGNASYFAAYLILISTLAFYLRFEKESFGLASYRRLFNYLYVAVAVISLVIVYISGTRGAFVGVFAGALVFILIYLWLVRKDASVPARLKKILIGLILVVILVPFGLVTLKDTQFVKSSPLLSRYATISVSEGQSRFLIWDMAVKGFKERPILGWGQEGFMYVFSKYYNPKMFNQEPWFDRTHNIIFDWLISAGILGLLSYLSILVGAFYVLVKLFKRNLLSRKGFLIFVSGIIAYFIQNLFVFDNLNTYLVFFAILAYLNSSNFDNAGEEVAKRNNTETIRSPIKVFGVSFLSLIVVAPFFYSANIKPMKQATNLIEMLSFSESRAQDGSRVLLGNLELAKRVTEEFEKTISYNTFGQGESIEQAGQISNFLLGNLGALQREHLEFIALTITELENYLGRFPDDIRMRLFIATVYNRAISLNSEFAERGFEHINKVIEISPRQLAYFVLAENYLGRGDLENATATARQAVDLAPEFEEAQATLGQFAVFARDYDLVQEVIDNNIESELILLQIAEAFLNTGDLGRAAVLFEGLAQRFPRDLNYLARLADIYLGLQRFDEAEAIAKVLAENDSDRFGARAQAFIERIESERNNNAN